MNLYELFDRTLPYEWSVDAPEEKHANFSLEDGTQYTVRFYYQDYTVETWEVYFRLESMPNREVGTGIGTMNSGSELLVFSTVRKIIKEFLQNVDPYDWHFASKELESSRVKLYDRFAREVQAMGYDMEIVRKHGEKYYHFAKR
jgi:hypothetical protein